MTNEKQTNALNNDKQLLKAVKGYANNRAATGVATLGTALLALWTAFMALEHKRMDRVMIEATAGTTAFAALAVGFKACKNGCRKKLEDAYQQTVAQSQRS